MNVINDEFCKCTKRRENKCSICGKDLPYVDSPFGAIPTFKLIESYFNKFEKKYNQDKEEFKKIIDSTVSTQFVDITEKVNNLLIEAKNRLDDFENSMDLKSQSIILFINRIFEEFNKYLSIFLNTVNLLSNLCKDYEYAKTSYINTFSSEITELINNLKILEKIFQKSEVYTLGILRSDPNEVFEINKEFISNNALRSKKKKFIEMWEDINLFSDTYSKKYSNIELSIDEKIKSTDFLNEQ
ncbi:MAG: hypothetical protein ACTSRP_05650 [Candidatus Helarchaeota archaeon]